MDTLIQSLQDPAIYPHPVVSVTLVETHISWVLLTGEYAYKIKKPVDFGFLDFSSLEKRRHFCQQELRLNSRLAEALYLDVVPIYGSAQHPTFSPADSIIEYAIKMVQFPQYCQLDRLLQRGELTQQHIDQIAEKVAGFHQRIGKADTSTPFGDPDIVQHAVLENFTAILTTADGNANPCKACAEALQRLEQWSKSEFKRLRDVLQKRKDEGYIRECHGDMHLRNIAFFNREIIVFDCLEFNEQLRWVDVMSEIAFLVMDLQDRDQPGFANMLLNRYLSFTGDYDGLRIFRYYLVYRAIVRAKVDCLRARQSDIDASEKAQALNEFGSYVSLARTYTEMTAPTLYITHGFSGSGKSRVARKLLLELPLIWLRSDVERKRAHGIAPLERSYSELNRGIYGQEATQQTYTILCEIAETLLRDGWSVIVDAAFLQRRHRRQFAELARRLNVTYRILDCVAHPDKLRQRVIKRLQRGQDASEADTGVLDAQLRSAQSFARDELDYIVHIDTDKDHEFSGAEIVNMLDEAP